MPPRGILNLVDADATLLDGTTVSFGITAVLNTFVTLSMVRKKPAYELYLINVSTMIRNNQDTGLTDHQIIEKTLLDIRTLSQYIAAYNTVVQSEWTTRSSPSIVFYIPKYVLPELHQRPTVPKGTLEREKLTQSIVGVLMDGATSLMEETKIHYCSVGTHTTLPHMDLMHDVRQVVSGASYKHTVLLSHVALDFHLYRKFSHFSLLESHTGKLKEKLDFGLKVFDDANIPFNKYTHLLLGDKQYVKSLLSRQDRKFCKEQAEKQKWALYPETQILKFFVDKNYVPQEWYTTLNI